ncbi:maleate cis-trans isomerase family protein [Limibacillus halophilus]|uniref:Maleate isomerase n=1 Tax=Limibacillus halophilus TaxID=1579333 RepID=A0A839SNW8_9PROT|nr:aspartate/glutamate racemase family protein [Limibacillus halophilus]MBB3064501.1 maleate isomerase [Limibacillus halophilus]
MKRVGLIVPSSNTTMETEIPALLRQSASWDFPGFTFHSSRARLHTVDVQSLSRMVDDGDRCAAELGDADVDVIAYACLVALMSRGAGAHKRIEAKLGEVVLGDRGKGVPIVSSAGALVRTLDALGLRKVALVAPYMPELTKMVIAYIEAAGVTVTNSVSLSISNNLAVGRLDPLNLPEHVAKLDLSGVDGLILSACVQMPSLPAVQMVQDKIGLPVITAATCTTREILLALGLDPIVPNAGAALGTQSTGVISKAKVSA